MSAVSRGDIETYSTSQRSGHVTRQPAKLLHAVDACVAPTTSLANVACEGKAVTAEIRALTCDLMAIRCYFTESQPPGTPPTEAVLIRILPNDWSNV